MAPSYNIFTDSKPEILAFSCRGTWHLQHRLKDESMLLSSNFECASSLNRFSR